MRKSKKPIFIISCGADVSTHYTSRFSSYANACVNPKNLFPTEIICHARKNRRLPFAQFQNIIFVMGRLKHALAILQTWEKYFFNTCPVLTAVIKNQQEMAAPCRQTVFVWKSIIRKGKFFFGGGGRGCRLYQKSCIGLSGVMDECDTCGRCGRNTSWCVVREYFFGIEETWRS